MRDAARKLTHRLHLLGLRELQFERLLLRRVDEIDDDARALTHIDPRRIKLADAVWAPREADIDRRGRELACPRVCNRLLDSLPVFLDEQGGELRTPLDALAHIGDEGTVRIVDPAFRIDGRNPDRGIVEEAGEPHLRVARRLFGLVASRPVKHQREDAWRAAAGRSHARPQDAHRKRLPIRSLEVDIERRQVFVIAGHSVGESRYFAEHEFRKLCPPLGEPLRHNVEPGGKPRIHEDELAVLIRGEEAERRLFDIGEGAAMHALRRLYPRAFARHVAKKPDGAAGCPAERADHGAVDALGIRRTDADIFFGRKARPGGLGEPEGRFRPFAAPRK